MKGSREANLTAEIGVAGSSIENQDGFASIQFPLELFDGDAVFRLTDDGLDGKEEPAADQEQREQARSLAQ